MHVRFHLDYCDFIHHIPGLKKKENRNEEGLDNHEDEESYKDQSAETEIVDDGHTKIKLNFRMRAFEGIQYQAALTITGAWKGTNANKLYMELGWESLHHRRCFRRITQFYKIIKGLIPAYLVDPIPVPRRHLFGRHARNDLYKFHCRNKRFLDSSPDSVFLWNELGPEMRNIESLSKFKTAILKTIRPEKSTIFKIHHPDGVKFICRPELS